VAGPTSGWVGVVSDAPQDEQKVDPSTFSAPHLEQNTFSPRLATDIRFRAISEALQWYMNFIHILD